MSEDESKVVGHNTDGSGETYGVWGEVDSPDGYGLYTPDDARIDGVVDGDDEWIVEVDDWEGAEAGKMIAGHPENAAADDVVGATIAGGGADWGGDSPQQVLDNYGTIGGGWGNETSGNTATIAGGGYNTASGSRSTICGGVDNQASGKCSVIGGGEDNVVGDPGGSSTDGHYATVGGGQGNHANGAYGTVSGGQDNETSGEYATVPGGLEASATHHGQVAHASGSFDDPGDAQAATYVLRGTTDSSGESTELFLDGQAERLTVESGRSMAFQVHAVASTEVGTSGSWHVRGAIKNYAGTTELVGSPDEVSHVDADLGTVDVVADDGNDALAVEVTADGNNSDGTNWVATVQTTETELLQIV